LTWFGNIARLSQWVGGGLFPRQMFFTCRGINIDIDMKWGIFLNAMNIKAMLPESVSEIININFV
jgi:hypothetical protein